MDFLQEHRVSIGSIPEEGMEDCEVELINNLVDEPIGRNRRSIMTAGDNHLNTMESTNLLSRGSKRSAMFDSI